MRRSFASLVGSLVFAALSVAPVHAQSTPGLTPLNDLGAGSYAGFTGGLYPGGANTPPPAHLTSALAAAAGIVPRNAAGVADASGWIGMIALGMSNTTHEFGAFERNADRDSTRHARVVLMDTGQGGQTATVLADPTASYWTLLAQRVAAMGLTPAQVQVAWLKEAEAGPPNNFPLHAQALRDTLARVVRNLHDKYPNVRVCYLSSRIYGGYAPQGSLNPEPQAYESGFAVKWLIEQQISGDPALNADAATGTVRAPWLLWGPYLWANGTLPRSDGLTWPLGDLEPDHVHPSPAGEQKVARLLRDFFASDTTAAAWWRAQPGTKLTTVDASDDATVAAASPAANFGADTLLTASNATGAVQNVFARFDWSHVADPVLLAKLSLRVFAAGGGSVRPVSDVSWNEGAITWSSAPAMGAVLVNAPSASRDGTLGVNVTSAVTGDADRRLSFAHTTPAAGGVSYHSREGGDPPRLVLVVSQPVTGAPPAAVRTLHLSAAPNPGRGEAELAFALAAHARVELSLHDVAGRRLRVLVAGVLPPGEHRVRWDGRDERGRPLPPGVYLARLGTPAGARTLRLVQLGTR